MKKLCAYFLLSAMIASATASAETPNRLSALPGLDPVPVDSWIDDHGVEMVQRDMTDVLRLFALDLATKAHGEHSDAATLANFLRRPHPSVTSLELFFREASEEFGVPAPWLMAIGQVESNWTHLGPSIDGGWGLMHLVENHHTQTLADAAALLGLDIETVRNDPRSNIRGAAALLRHYWYQVHSKERPPSQRLEPWYEPVMLFSGLSTEETRRLQAEAYLTRLREGGKSLTLWGESVVLAPHRVRPRALLEKSPARAQKSTDYGPATFYPVSCKASGRSATIDTWVNHYIATANATYASTISYFQSCDLVTTPYDNRVSSHFLVGQGGQIAQFVSVSDTAWHAVSANPRSIGVEHEVTVANPSLWNTPAMLQASADLASYFADLYGIPRVRGLPGVIGHNEVVATACPANLPWATWMSLFNSGGGGGGGGGGGTGNAAAFVHAQSSVPNAIVAGQSLPVTVRLQNTGGSTWTAGTAYRLGADTGDGFRWNGMQCGGYSNQPGDSRVFLCHDVAPGGTHDFSFYIDFPQGTFSETVDLSMQMVRDGVEWFGESFTQRVNVVGGDCGCPSGISFWDQPIPVSDTWCGFKVCGKDNQIYSCTGSSWSGTSVFGCSDCRCSGGWDYQGNPIDSDYTYCGFEVCGSDHTMYRCTNTNGGSWLRLAGTTCP